MRPRWTRSSSGLGVDRASILLFDPDGVMRFKAYRGLSDDYRRAVEGHTPWKPDSPDPQPIWVSDVATDSSLAAYLPVFAAERIAALAFIPLVSLDRVIGKFMLYYAAPTHAQLRRSSARWLIAAQVAFAVERTRTEEQARRSEERLRFALDAASMGTWDWDLSTNRVQWSDNLSRIHGLTRRRIRRHVRQLRARDSSRRSRACVRVDARALNEGVPHDVEYRIVRPTGRCAGAKARAASSIEDGRPARMSGVCMMVTRRKEAELARLAAAEESSRLKDEFLATLSHELRTPLNAILGWVQMLQAANCRRRARSRRSRSSAATPGCRRNSSRTSWTCRGSSPASSRSTAPGFRFTAPRNGRGRHRPAADAKRIAFASESQPDLPPIEGDPKRLHQVLNNVLSNAVKFTPEGGSVVLRLQEADAHWLNIEIRDSGVGIAPRVPAVSSSTASGRPTAGRRARTVVLGWGSRSRGTWSSSMAARSGRTATGPVKEQPYRFGYLPGRRLCGAPVTKSVRPESRSGWTTCQFSWSTTNAIPARRLPHCSSSAAPPCFRLTRPNRR